MDIQISLNQLVKLVGKFCCLPLKTLSICLVDVFVKYGPEKDEDGEVVPFVFRVILHKAVQDNNNSSLIKLLPSLFLHDLNFFDVKAKYADPEHEDGIIGKTFGIKNLMVQRLSFGQIMLGIFNFRLFHVPLKRPIGDEGKQAFQAEYAVVLKLQVVDYQSERYHLIPPVDAAVVHVLVFIRFHLELVLDHGVELVQLVALGCLPAHDHVVLDDILVEEIF